MNYSTAEDEMTSITLWEDSVGFKLFLVLDIGTFIKVSSGVSTSVIRAVPFIGIFTFVLISGKRLCHYFLDPFSSNQ